MFNSIWEFLALFGLVTAIFSMYKLFIPSLKVINGMTDEAATKLKNKRYFAGFLFFIVAFFASPIMFIVLMSDEASDAFIVGFTESVTK